MRGLYAIVDVGVLAKRGIEPVPFAQAVLAARPAALQLRAKELPARETLALLRALAPLCRQHSVMLVANDRPDLAALAGCDAVHIGQQDVPVDLVHRIAPQLAVGISTHDLDQLEKALDARPAYVAYGPVFFTKTKENPDPVVGLEGLRAAAQRARARGIPIVAVGGISAAHAPAVARVADAAAVISALLPSSGASLEDVARRASSLHAALMAGSAPHEARP
jgi:thiamine-phosphate pyrophosphorylase